MENQNVQNVQTTQAAASAANSQQTAGNTQGAVTVSAESIAAASSGTGSAGNFPRTGGDNSIDYAVRLAEARKSGNNTLAAAIISEAAAKGIYLR